MKDGCTIEEHMARTELILAELADLDEEVEDKVLAQIMLCSLPTS